MATRVTSALGGLVLLGALAGAPADLPAQTTADAPAVRPAALIDLRTHAGAELAHAQWRFTPARIVAVDHQAPGPDLRPSGAAIRTHDIEPHAGAADFDDASWETVDPTALEARRGTGRLSFAWYRTSITIPERVAAFDPTSATVVFEIVVDDYAEVWVNGRLPVVLGQAGGPLIKGFNTPNRVVLGRDVRPGQRFQIAVFTANGPLSNPPVNFIWIRSATLEFHAAGHLPAAERFAAEVDRRDARLDAIVPADAQIERLATGFLFTEGPVWVPEGGYLLFSDPNANRIYRWTPDGEVSVFRTNSGYTGFDVAEYGQPGSNGLTLDGEGRLTINEHGNRRVTRLERNGVLTVLAERYEGKRLNSPNDLVYRSDGALFISDPPFGLPRFGEDPRKELAANGVYCLKDGGLRLVSGELRGPNGVALSPDEQYLYVGNWDPDRKIVMRYDVQPDCSLTGGRVFVDMTAAPGEDAIDGVKVDQRGNVYVSGPGGLWILSPEGVHLGTLNGPEHPHNFAWGDADGRTLYMTARSGLYRVRLSVPGVRPGDGPMTQAAGSRP